MLPSRRSPRPTRCRRGVRKLGWRWRDCAGKRDPANGCWLCGGVGMRDQPTLRFSLRCEAGCRLCYPGSRTRDVICNAAHCRIPLAREPSASGPRRLPGAIKGKCGSHRPTARFIEDNSVLCVHRLRRCHADCFPPSPAARGRPPRGSHRAILQASFTPAVRAAV